MEDIIDPNAYRYKSKSCQESFGTENKRQLIFDELIALDNIHNFNDTEMRYILANHNIIMGEHEPQ